MIASLIVSVGHPFRKPWYVSRICACVRNLIFV
jgi:hypothetical protein